MDAVVVPHKTKLGFLPLIVKQQPQQEESVKTLNKYAKVKKTSPKAIKEQEVFFP